ncbi:hypothetical protein AZE42_12497 [Rhizopogon vesiculosus]|uniref:Uncharacterized protein n=1 Tax=Rhizopogon vesiculosus TaxID=180088 RepID=A0A1J8Q553_9AGAM|nr:hypothetical protein AZE42_12497 [Rhizopogon vesiculosus]
MLCACLRLIGHSDSESHNSEDNSDDGAGAAALCALPRYLCVDEPQDQSIEGEKADVIDGPTVQAHVDLAMTAGGPHNVPALAANLELPNFPMMIQQFLHDQHHDHADPLEFDPGTVPAFMGRVSTFSSTSASFYAPSDLSGTGGMRHEYIRATPTW